MSNKIMIAWINNYIDKLKREGKEITLKKLELKENKNRYKRCSRRTPFINSVIKIILVFVLLILL